MKGRKLWVLSGLILVILALLLACGPSATPTPKPTTTTPAAKPAPTTAPAKTTTAPASPKVTASPAASGVSFAGKTITIVVPSSAGGGSDLAARVYARFLGKYLPGNPAIVVRNIAGGGGTIGSNYVYQSAKPDGLTLLQLSSTQTLGELLGGAGIKYKLSEMPAIVGTAQGVFFGLKSGIISKPEDITKAKGIIFGYAAGTAGTPWIVARELLNFSVDKAVFAYTGSGDSRRAFLAGEINMIQESSNSYGPTILPYIQKGEVMVVCQSGIINDKGELVKDPALPKDILTAGDLYQKIYGKPPSGEVWTAFKQVIAGGRSFQRVLSLPPKTPENILDTYWAATQKLIKDTTFLKEADSSPDDPWGAGKAYDTYFKSQFGMDPKSRELIKQMSDKYGLLFD